jgi:predicted metal-binding membrane protein
MFAASHLRYPRRDRAILAGSLVALSGLAWLTLWLWAGSPWGRYLHHEGGLGSLPLEAALSPSAGWS